MNWIAIVVVATWIARDAFALIAHRSPYLQAAEQLVAQRVAEEQGRAFLVCMSVSKWAFEVALLVLVWRLLS